MFKFEDGLAWYLENKEKIRQFNQYCICFCSVDNWIENPTKAEYSMITAEALAAYSKDEDHNELDIFSDFLAEGISTKYFSLIDIVRSDSFTIAEAALNHDFAKIKK